MKKFLLPAVFVIALAGSAFTRSSSANTSSKRSLQGYYYDINSTCQSWLFDDPNCSPYDGNYLCYEYVLGWQIMFQWQVGNTCLEPYYSTICNAPGYCFQ